MKKIVVMAFFLIVLSFSSFASVIVEEEGEMEYKNVVETEISGYVHDSRGAVDGFGYNVPFEIHYNDFYKTQSGFSIEVNEFVVIDGVPTLNITMHTERPGDRASCKTTIRCYTSVEKFTDIETDSISSLLSEGATDMACEPLIGSELIDYFNKNRVTSIEVWVDEYDYSKK